jgi:hypothetical protein
VVVASAVFRGEAGVAGPSVAGFGAALAFGDGLAAGGRGGAGGSGAQPPALPVRPPREGLSEAEQTVALTDHPPRWRSLHRELRRNIDAQAPAAAGWTELGVRASGDGSGSAADLRFRARSDTAGTRELPHFVIGNGSRSDDGAIEMTDRALAESTVDILLIGGGSDRPPTAAQLHALTELVDYLRAKAGMVPVRMAAGGPTGAPHGVAVQAIDFAFNRSLAVTPGAAVDSAAR